MGQRRRRSVASFAAAATSAGLADAWVPQHGLVRPPSRPGRALLQVFTSLAQGCCSSPAGGDSDGARPGARKARAPVAVEAAVRKINVKIQAAGERGDLEGVKAALHELEGRYFPNVYTLNSVINACLRCGCSDAVLDAMWERLVVGWKVQPNVVSFNTLMKRYLSAGNSVGSRSSSSQNGRNGHKGRPTLFGGSAGGCKDPLAAATSLTSQMRASGVQPDEFTYNTLLGIAARQGEMAVAEYLVTEMRSAGLQASSHTLSMLMRGYGALGEVDKALACFAAARRGGWEPNPVARVVLAEACMAGGDAAAAVRVMSELVEKDGGASADVITCNVLLKAYRELGAVDDALRLLAAMPTLGLKAAEQTDPVAGDASSPRGGAAPRVNGDGGRVVNAFVRDRPNNMGPGGSGGGRNGKSRGVTPDETTYNTVVDACCRVGRLDDAEAVVSQMRANGVVPSATTFNSFVRGHLQGDSPSLEAALAVPVRMGAEGVRPDAFTVALVISACVQVGQSLEGVRQFVALRDAGALLSAVAYTAMLRAVAAAAAAAEAAIDGPGGAAEAAAAAAALERGSKRPTKSGRRDSSGTNGGRDSSSDIGGGIRDEGTDAARQLAGAAAHCVAGMRAAGITPNRSTYNALLAVAAAARDLPLARATWAEMRARRVGPDPFSYGEFVRCFVAAGEPSAAPALLDEAAAAGVEVPLRSYSTLIRALGTAGDLPAAEAVFARFKVQQLHLQQQNGASATGAAALAAAAALRRLSPAGSAEEEALLAWNAMATAYLLNRCPGVAMDTVAAMEAAGVRPNVRSHELLARAHCRVGNLKAAARALVASYEEAAASTAAIGAAPSVAGAAAEPVAAAAAAMEATTAAPAPAASAPAVVEPSSGALREVVQRLIEAQEAEVLAELIGKLKALRVPLDPGSESAAAAAVLRLGAGRLRALYASRLPNAIAASKAARRRTPP